MSKVLLKKYQRNLIPYFKKYQLTELEGDKDTASIASERLGSAAQNLIEGKDEAENLRIKELNLLETVLTSFDSEQN